MAKRIGEVARHAARWIGFVKFIDGQDQSARQSYFTGSAVVFFIVSVYAAALLAVFNVGGETDIDLWQNAYLRQVLAFGLWQAALSSLLSTFIGLLFAHAFFYTPFRGKSLILRLFSLTFVLPTLVAVWGLLGVYGLSGWLNQGLQWLGYAGDIRIYGLSGILLANLFFNIPLAARMGLQALHAIPHEQHRLAAQLGMGAATFFRLVEFPYLKQQLIPAFMLIFMLCFTGFSIVLALGGGPQYSTLEVAIYQAVFFEFDLPKAALFALVQLGLCLALFAVGQRAAKPLNTPLSHRPLWLPTPQSAVKFCRVLLIGSVCLFLLLPLANVIWQAVTVLFDGATPVTLWQNPQFWRALGFSLALAPTSASLTLLFSVAILLAARRLQWQKRSKTAALLQHSGMISLAVPTLILAMGLFLLLQQIDFSDLHLFLIVVCCNAFAALPFVLRILSVPMNQNMQYYEKLCQLLNIRGWQRFWLIERERLQTPLRYAFAVAAAFSLGDFTAIALFGTPHFTSLPHFLYQQLGQYKTADAAVAALILLLLCVGLFLIIEKNGKHHDFAE